MALFITQTQVIPKMERRDIKNPVWSRMLLGQEKIQLNFLAANILLGRLKLLIKYANTPAQLEAAIAEIFDLYYRSQALPSAQKDIANLLKPSYFTK
jgi:hypothetical protein